MAEQKYASTTEFARLVRLSPSTVRRRILDDSLVTYQPGGPGTALRIDISASLHKLATAQQDADVASSSPKAVSLPEAEQSLSGPKPRWMGNVALINRKSNKDAKETKE